jgi:hypothetical protein
MIVGALKPLLRPQVSFIIRPTDTQRDAMVYLKVAPVSLNAIRLVGVPLHLGAGLPVPLAVGATVRPPAANIVDIG